MRTRVKAREIIVKMMVASTNSIVYIKRMKVVNFRAFLKGLSSGISWKKR